jgi:hypothetical protein
MPVRYGISLSELRLADALLARTYKFQIPAQTEHQHAHFRSSALMSALPPKADICSALALVCFGPIAEIGGA